MGQEGLIGQYAHGNEPSHHVAYLYKLAGEGSKTDALIREITERFYDATPEGITGNEDCGQMSAWYVFSVLGLYPVDPSSAEYVLGAPQIAFAKVRLAAGMTLSIEARGLSAKNKYVKQVIWNGRPYTKSVLRHSALARGGRLVFVMTDVIE